MRSQTENNKNNLIFHRFGKLLVGLKQWVHLYTMNQPIALVCLPSEEEQEIYKNTLAKIEILLKKGCSVRVLLPIGKRRYNYCSLFPRGCGVTQESLKELNTLQESVL